MTVFPADNPKAYHKLVACKTTVALLKQKLYEKCLWLIQKGYHAQAQELLDNMED
jgi:hypothetical protein